MFSELECGICYRTYNAGRRCPRELQCKHSFCQSCLLALSRQPGPEEAHPGADRLIVCPLCRQTTSISAVEKVRAELKVDECILERLLTAGVLDREEEEEEEDQEEGECGCDDDDQGATLPDAPAEESDSSAGSRGGRFRRSWKKVWRNVMGKSSPQNGGESK